MTDTPPHHSIPPRHYTTQGAGSSQNRPPAQDQVDRVDSDSQEDPERPPRKQGRNVHQEHVCDDGHPLYPPPGHLGGWPPGRRPLQWPTFTLWPTTTSPPDVTPVPPLIWPSRKDIILLQSSRQSLMPAIRAPVLAEHEGPGFKFWTGPEKLNAYSCLHESCMVISERSPTGLPGSTAYTEFLQLAMCGPPFECLPILVLTGRSGNQLFQGCGIARDYEDRLHAAVLALLAHAMMDEPRSTCLEGLPESAANAATFCHHNRKVLVANPSLLPSSFVGLQSQDKARFGHYEEFDTYIRKERSTLPPPETAASAPMEWASSWGRKLFLKSASHQATP
jgi:hypothetical protein